MRHTRYGAVSGGVGQYGSVVATSDSMTVTVPVTFYVIGNTRFSQYKFPYESQCPANPKLAWVVYKMDASPNGNCYYIPVSLGANVIAQTIRNGTKVSVDNEILKSYASRSK